MCQDIQGGIGVGPHGIRVVENQVEKEMEKMTWTLGLLCD